MTFYYFNATISTNLINNLLTQSITTKNKTKIDNLLKNVYFDRFNMFNRTFKTSTDIAANSGVLYNGGGGGGGKTFVIIVL